MKVLLSKPAEPPVTKPDIQPVTVPVMDAPEAVETVYLLGRPTLGRFLRRMRREAIDGATRDEGALADEWRRAWQHLQTLESSEAHEADAPRLDRLPAGLESLRDEFLQTPLVRNSFNTVPTTIAMVELDRLVVYQKHIDLAYVAGLKARLGPQPPAEAVFRFCLPTKRLSPPPVKWAQAENGDYVFVSPSNDLRFLGARTLPSGAPDATPWSGTPAGVVGLAVGFGTNLLNAISAGQRLVLHNGYHRAFALRELGVTHAPCVVQLTSSWDELFLVASRELRERPNYYLQQPRPPLLRDYFDDKLRKIVLMRRQLCQVTVKVEVRQGRVPAM